MMKIAQKPKGLQAMRTENEAAHHEVEMRTAVGTGDKEHSTGQVRNAVGLKVPRHVVAHHSPRLPFSCDI
jgi:hypothetical protein